MATPKTLTRRRLDELLADGRWHEREELVEKLIPTVPPGRAHRRAEANRRRRSRGDRVRSVDEITIGARDLVGRTIWDAMRYGAIEQRERDGVAEYRAAVCR